MYMHQPTNCLASSARTLTDKIQLCEVQTLVRQLPGLPRSGPPPLYIHPESILWITHHGGSGGNMIPLIVIIATFDVGGVKAQPA